MDASILSVHWHENSEPIYSVNFQPRVGDDQVDRLVTGGGDNNVRLWRLNQISDGYKVEYLSTLAKHTQAVNAVRFDPKGQILATAGDDGTVLLWTLSESIVKEFGQESDEDIQESWILRHACRSSTSEIYDIAWSPDSKYLITGSTDNVSRIYDASNGQQVCQIAEHNHFVQGVAWDPLNQYIATQSADRSVHIYSLTNPSSKDQSLSPTVFYKISRTELPTRSTTNNLSLMGPPTPVKSSNEDDNSTNNSSNITNSSNLPKSQSSATTSASASPYIKSPSPSSPLPAVMTQTNPLLNFKNLKNSMLYHTENLESFFRRLSFSPDGNFLFTPSGIFKNNSQNDEVKEELINTVYIYSRNGLNKPPIAHLPGLTRPALAISFSPIFYELDEPEKKESIFKLPYKMIYAVATQDSVIIYDTQHIKPLGTVSNIHYRTLTDLTWSANGEYLVASAADGFCSVINFKFNSLGKKLIVDYKSLLNNSKSQDVKVDNKSTSSPSSQNKKRQTNDVKEITGLVKKKQKSNTTKEVKPTQESKKEDGQEVIDLSESKEPKSIKDQLKRVTPTLVNDEDKHKTNETHVID
ncbi:putative WD repeat-containing protein [Wickerhamomyces ciferrii]|uniref:WD repeat-containing protein n=1 Tax=Wickerhamomyces ciferrii (strain ATCC 14091 / BCRC 22168 / CBS 111 / JCM 3599 / NBRC 0793 / NRRL Y-1031 F-60-10) TaxID=1206466 RepID=K0KKD7_WICCF|nr:putative WD repeat-containing protein [Wickerhamomyces ciferrii]CCH41934.1 putative WD repeat-containing protein [Wickerhamomyces ciferrii]